MRTINRIQEIKEELFQFDPAIANNFKKHFSAEIDKFAEKTNKALTAYEQLDSTSTSNEQNAYIAAFIFYAIHCLIASEKLLIHGYPVPSGNQMRTAMESLAMAILCSAKNMPYYNEIKDDKFKT
ncbi:MAG: hypothetical protein HZA03_01285, partial [Nitrospinae bacterium]|nr:hypothetical protein [Nitrospinota bacterium]